MLWQMHQKDTFNKLAEVNKIMNEYTPESTTAVGRSSKDILKVGIMEEPTFIEKVAQSQDGTRGECGTNVES